MDHDRFDRLVQFLGAERTRRTTLGALLSAALLGIAPDAVAKRGKQKGQHHARGKAKRNDKGQGKNARHQRRQRDAPAQVEAEACWRANTCRPATGSNVSYCDLENSTAFVELDCTRCNISRANLRGANLSGANFTRANLSGSCLVDANFSGAIFANSTNLTNAIFCRTTMPNGSINNSGCALSTACCSTCVPCEANEVCVNGACEPLRCGNGGSCLVFFTGIRTAGNLGGLTGADRICQERAVARGLPGSYMAWLADDTGSPSTRFMRSPGPYVRLDGVRVANNWADLTDGALLNPINVSDQPPTTDTLIWSNTNPNGTLFATDRDCSNWTSTDGNAFGGVGFRLTTDARWPEFGVTFCDFPHSLYCFQQA